MKSDPFAKSASFAAAVSGASFSASAAIRSTIDHAFPRFDGASPYDRRRIFVEHAIRSAGAVLTAYNGGEPVNVATSAPFDAAGCLLVVDPETILGWATTDPDAAVDYATGRLLTQASAGEVLRAGEIRFIRDAVRNSRNRADVSLTAETIDRDYATAHLAAGVAATRGRERVLAKWPGWASYFAAAGIADVPKGLAEYTTNPKHPAIRRASASIVARLNGWRVPEDPKLAAAITEGEAAARAARWKLGTVVADADAVIGAVIAHLPKEENGKGNEGDGAEPPPEHQDDETQPPTQDADAIPGSEAEETQGRERQPSLNDSRIMQEIRPTPPSCDPPNANVTEYSVARLPVQPSRRHAEQMRSNAAPLLAAVRRVAWDTLQPPQFDRGQATGELDEGAMHRLAAWADPEVFEVREDEGRGRVAVFLLVDCSGSMQSGGRITDARAVAFALATAFGSLPRYTLRIAGHDVGYGPRRVRLWQCEKPDAISGLVACGDNADGFAIHAAMREIEAVPAERRAVLLLADGQPNAHGYGGVNAARHIRTIVEAGEKRGTQFLALGIGGSMVSSGAALFGRRRFVSIPDTRSAGPLLARVMARMGREVHPCV